MKRPATALITSLLLASWPAYAHDIGVSQTELLETVAGNYQLRVLARPGATAMFPSPELPERCAFSGSTRGVQGTAWKTFEFTCEEGLTPDDALILPWRRDGIMLTAIWADGSEVRNLFKNESGVIQVNLAELRVGSGGIATT